LEPAHVGEQELLDLVDPVHRKRCLHRLAEEERATAHEKASGIRCFMSKDFWKITGNLPLRSARSMAPQFR
jgi:hypothetical protein